MRILRQTPQELVVVDSSRWVSAICAVATLYSLYYVIGHHELKGLFVSAFLLLCALAFDLRKTFTFDSMQRAVRWKGRTILKAESGEIPFDDITSIDAETQITSDHGATIPVYRLAITTSKATIPMAYNYRGVTDGYSALRRQILDFIRPGSQSPFPAAGGAAAEAQESSLRALLRQGRKMDAITLLRSTENIGMTEAVKRIEAIECGIQQEE